MSFVSILLIATTFLCGCASLTSREPVGGKDSLHPYISEIDIPEAKAYFAYAQFRMLIIDNRWDEAIAALGRALAFDPQSEKLQLTLAKAYLHTQQLDQGDAVLESLLQQNPEHKAALELMGELRVYQERYSEALINYKKLSQSEPGNETYRLRLIAIYDQQGDLIHAMEETVALLNVSSDSVPGQLALARLQRRNKQTGEAIKTYRRLLVKRPGQLQAILELGKIFEQQEQVGEAVDLYRESLNDNPELLSVYKQLARILILQENYAEALNILQQAHFQRPDDVQILTRMGLLQLSREDYTAGEESFRRVLARSPDDASALYSLGMALAGQFRNQEALEVFTRIPQESEVYIESILQVGYLYRQEGDLRRGISLLQQAVESGHNSAEVTYYLSAFLGEDGQLAAAGQLVRRGIEAYPQDVRLRYQLGVIYEQMDDRPQALAAMEDVLTLDPTHAEALNFVAYHFAERGENLEQALVQAKSALAQRQTSYIYDTLGWIYFRMGRLEEAVEHLEKALALDPEDPLIQEHFGDVLTALKRWDEAISAYRKSLTLDNTSLSAESKLQQLLKDHPSQ